jgi:archaellum component FlaF (FlaF/FlaG flagellin family)
MDNQHHTHILEFIWSIIDNWAGYFTGGVIIAVITIWLTWKGQVMTRKILILISVCFFLMAIYKAWEQQYERADLAVEEQNKDLRQTHDFQESLSSARTTIDSLNATLWAKTNQSANVNSVIPPINQSATTIVQSFGQQGGIIANTVIVTNNAGAVFKASVVIAIDDWNIPKNGKYVTKGHIHLSSPYPVGMLYIIAYGKSILNRDGIIITPTMSGMVSESAGINGDMHFAGVQNAYGDYNLEVTSTNQERFNFQWYIP